MTKDNAVFNEMKRVGHEWGEWRAAYHAKKQSIIDTYGWTSRELRVWYEEQEAHKFPLSTGESKAYRAWAESLARQQTEMEVSDSLFESEVHDFIETLRRAGIDSFVYTSTSTAAIENFYAFDAEGYRLEGLCTITRCENCWNGEKSYDVKGIRFTRA